MKKNNLLDMMMKLEAKMNEVFDKLEIASETNEEEWNRLNKVFSAYTNKYNELNRQYQEA